MRKTYKINVDCAMCALNMEDAAAKVDGVKKVSVHFMLLKMIVDFEDGADPKTVMPQVVKACKKVANCDIFVRD